MVSISRRNWLLVWVGVELSFLGLIPLILVGNKYIRVRKESTLKYFCIQALRSAVLFFSGILYYLDFRFFSGSMFIISLCLKLGLFPGHFWVPSVLSGLEFLSVLLLLSWQKVPPLALILSYIRLNSDSSFLVFLGGARALLGGVIGLNIQKVRAIIGASSISHTGWTVIGALTGNLWSYFTVYCVALGLGLWFVWERRLIGSLTILSLSGLPPFVLFVGKWNIVNSALSRGLSLEFLLLPILGTVLRLGYYLKFFYSYYLNGSMNSAGWGLPLVLMNFIGICWLGLFFGDRIRW